MDYKKAPRSNFVIQNGTETGRIVYTCVGVIASFGGKTIPERKRRRRREDPTPPPPEWRTSFRMNAWEKGWACTDFRWPYQLPWHPHWVWQWWTYCASFVNGRIRNWIAIGYREYKCKSSLLLWKRKRGRMLCIFPLALVRIDIYKRLTIFQAWAGNRISSESK